MPNWCENDLFVRGPAESVREFLALATGDRSFDFNRFVPYPEHFRSLDEIAEKWDEDLRTNPKWPACRVIVEEAKPCKDGLEVLIRFDTAWSPPKPVAVTASKLFPSLVIELRYFDGGAGFCGTYIAGNSECMLDTTSTYSGDRGG